jgi:hypothetical protein
VKTQELRMSLDILARYQTRILESELEEKQLLVKTRKMEMLLIQASLRVQLLTEKKLKKDLGEDEGEDEGKEQKVQVVRSRGVTDDDDEEEFVEANEEF